MTDIMQDFRRTAQATRDYLRTEWREICAWQSWPDRARQGQTRRRLPHQAFRCQPMRFIFRFWKGVARNAARSKSMCLRRCFQAWQFPQYGDYCEDPLNGQITWAPRLRARKRNRHKRAARAARILLQGDLHRIQARTQHRHRRAARAANFLLQGDRIPLGGVTRGSPHIGTPTSPDSTGMRDAGSPGPQVGTGWSFPADQQRAALRTLSAKFGHAVQRLAPHHIQRPKFLNCVTLKARRQALRAGQREASLASRVGDLSPLSGGPTAEAATNNTPDVAPDAPIVAAPSNTAPEHVNNDPDVVTQPVELVAGGLRSTCVQRWHQMLAALIEKRRRRQQLVQQLRAALHFRRRARESRRVHDLRYGSDAEVIRRVHDIANTIAQAMHDEALPEDVSTEPGSAPAYMPPSHTDGAMLPARRSSQEVTHAVGGGGISNSLAHGERTGFLTTPDEHTECSPQGARVGTWVDELHVLELPDTLHTNVTSVTSGGKQTIIRPTYAHPQSAYCLAAPYRLFHFDGDLQQYCFPAIEAGVDFY